MPHEFEEAFAGLYSAEADKELNPLCFDDSVYPEVSVMIEHIFANIENKPNTPSLKSLAVNGLVVADPMKEYLAAPFISSSACKKAIISPETYFFYMHDKENFTEKPKKCFEFGTFAHMAFLESKLFDKTATEPKYSLASKDGAIAGIRHYEKLNKQAPLAALETLGLPELKEILAELKAECPYEIVQEEDKLIIEILKRNYYRYGGGVLPMILKGAIYETSFYGNDPATGLRVKCRPDALNFKENIGVNAVISFKTTRAETVGKFIYDTAKLQYEVSEGMYLENISNITGRDFNTVIMIMLQSVPPYAVAVFWWSPEDLHNGKYKYHHALSVIKDCQYNKYYPGFEALAEAGNYGIITLIQPDWAKKLIQPIDTSLE